MRQEFSKKTKLAAWERCKGVCECGCGQRILGTPEYDHIIPAGIGGSADLDNCRVMAKRCHRIWTDSEKGNSEIYKTTRILEKRAGVRKGRGFRKPPAGYDPWNRRMRDEA